MDNEQNLLILPDIHGRTFYKEVLNDTTSKIVFLGDYVDPYPQEEITVEDAIVNLEEIIDFKQKNKDRVSLLLGNHDCGYIWPDVCSCRRSRRFYNDIKTMFKDNMDLFDLAFTWKTKDKNYLLSHAGVHKLWFDFVYNIVSKESPKNYDNISDYLNNILHSNHSYLCDFLEVYSHYRGWTDSPVGSCVWADLNEWFDDNVKDDKDLPYYQIFGHSQLVKDPVIEEKFACIDCRRIFNLNEIINYGKN